MDININLLEVASELAHQVVCAKFEDDDTTIYQNTTDTVTSYTEEAQDLFNEWYDYYYELLFNLKIN
jgi:hypothetical protein